jgi:hypothetical protein
MAADDQTISAAFAAMICSVAPACGASSSQAVQPSRRIASANCRAVAPFSGA